MSGSQMKKKSLSRNGVKLSGEGRIATTTCTCDSHKLRNFIPWGGMRGLVNLPLRSTGFIIKAMNILIVNLHSALNLGDDAIMTVTLDGLRLRYPSAQITLAANDPDSWSRYHLPTLPSMCSWLGDCRLGRFRTGAWRLPGILVLLLLAALLNRLFSIKLQLGNQDARALLIAYYQADLVLSCGGGNYYAQRSYSPSFVMALLSIAFAVGLKKPVVMLPQSFGPVEGKVQHLLARWVFRRAHLVTARESESLRFFEENLSLPAPLLLTDLAFGLPPIYLRSDQLTYPKIGITIIDRQAQDRRFSRQAGYEQSLMEVLQFAQVQYHAEIHIFVQCSGPSVDQDDRHTAERLNTHLVASNAARSVFLHPPCRSALELRQLYTQMDVLIGSRLHTGILGLGCSTPVIIIAYQPKTIGIMRDAGLADKCFAIQDVTGQDLITSLSDVLADLPAARRQTATAYQAQYQRIANWYIEILP